MTIHTAEAGHPSLLTKDEWLGVLRLAQKYQMDKVQRSVLGSGLAITNHTFICQRSRRKRFKPSPTPDYSNQSKESN